MMTKHIQFTDVTFILLFFLLKSLEVLKLPPTPEKSFSETYKQNQKCIRNK